MSIKRVREYFNQFNMEDKVMEFEVSSATVTLAAEALSVIPARICKTISFKKPEGGCILIQAAGDTKIDNSKFKKEFGFKAKMLSPEEALEYTGYAVGGICAFGIENEEVNIYTDISIQRFDTVFPACGTSNSAIELDAEGVYKYSQSIKWVDICKIREEE